MGWMETLKEKTRDHIVKAFFALLALLLSAIWKAVPADIWCKVSDVIPKQILWAVIAVELIIIGLQAAFALDNKRRFKKASLPEQPPKPLRKFNVHWDTEACPLCLHCNVTLSMTDSGIISGERYEVFGCPKCRFLYRLYDDSGSLVLLNQAIPAVENELAKRQTLTSQN